MIEVELKSVVDDVDAARRRIETRGATLHFAGRLEDRRYDRPRRTLSVRDQVLRVRVYRDAAGAAAKSSLDWKGPTSFTSGYKERDEVSTSIGDADTLALMLERLGFVVTMMIDRTIWQYELHNAIVRFERYPRMDDLVEVEGAPDEIERAVEALGIPRERFSSRRLPDFVRDYEARTGARAALSDGELAGRVRYDIRNA